jgi:hypothetical protein
MTNSYTTVLDSRWAARHRCRRFRLRLGGRPLEGRPPRRAVGRRSGDSAGRRRQSSRIGGPTACRCGPGMVSVNLKAVWMSGPGRWALWRQGQTRRCVGTVLRGKQARWPALPTQAGSQRRSRLVFRLNCGFQCRVWVAAQAGAEKPWPGICGSYANAIVSLQWSFFQVQQFCCLEQTCNSLMANVLIYTKMETLTCNYMVISWYWLYDIKISWYHSSMISY